jgi:uncharacterized membrane protein YphA (DoxX/SURF4 family)
MNLARSSGLPQGRKHESTLRRELVMKVAVWIVSGLLAVAFLFAGLFKLLASTADLEASAQGVPVILLRIAGTAEVLGAIGLIVPAATRIKPTLTPLAATGLVLTMIGATITNFIIGEYAVMAETMLLGVLSGWVAWARFRQYAGGRFRVGSAATG